MRCRHRESDYASVQIAGLGVKRSLGSIAVIVAVMFFAAPAWAGNSAHPKLDAAAATISGDSSLLTFCENNQGEWDRWTLLAGVPTGGTLFGFTFLLNPDPLTGGHFVYVSPRTCSVLTAYVDGIPPRFRSSFPYEEVGAAVLTLTHEAMHQRLRSNDEALVECNALKYLPWVIQTVFGTSETKLVTKEIRARVRRHGKWIRVWRAEVRRVIDPDYAAMISGAVLLDAGTPAPYHGATC